MRYFVAGIQLTSSRRPALLTNETSIIQQGNVGLYEGKNKVEHYQDGVCYLTSHRIVYVDSQAPEEYAAELDLSLVTRLESYGGFLRSSPKIILHLSGEPAQNTVHARPASTPQSPSVANWACPICYYSNPGANVACEVCGVKRSTSDAETITPVAPRQNSQATQNMQDDHSGTSCPGCTFINHPSMMQCEMCGTDLGKLTAVVPSPSQSETRQETTSEGGEVRIAFRHGGQPSFLAKLKQVLENKAWEQRPPPSSPAATNTKASSSASLGVGIRAVENRIDKSAVEANDTMSDAFRDLDTLMAKATDMVAIAESISAKINKEPNTESDMSVLRNYLLELGISNPVTRGNAGSIYHQELARELADFLYKFIDKKNGMKSMTDLYCVFNRVRGVALISPDDLYNACTQFEALHLPFRLRRFPSGLLVVQSIDMDDDSAARHVLRHVKDVGGALTALRLAQLENLAIAIATEQLLMAEQKGLLCRDDGPAGLTFYENTFFV